MLPMLTEALERPKKQLLHRIFSDMTQNALRILKNAGDMEVYGVDGGN